MADERPLLNDDDDPEAIRQRMQETRASLSEKLESLERTVTNTVEEAKSAVTNTVEEAKSVVSDTVESVKETFNLRLQVERHPWEMMGGSVVFGFLGGWLLGKVEQGPRPHNRGNWSDLPPSNGTASQQPPTGRQLLGEPQPQGKSWLGELASVLEPEINRLKGLAVGTAAAVVRDLVADAIPVNLRPQVTTLMDNVTRKLGGTPVEGHILPEPKEETERPIFRQDRAAYPV